LDLFSLDWINRKTNKEKPNKTDTIAIILTFKKYARTYPKSTETTAITIVKTKNKLMFLVAIYAKDAGTTVKLIIMMAPTD
jgi:hypothetical protein